MILLRYHETVRQEVKDFMKTSERLINLARQTDELSEEECQILDYYVTELKEHSPSYLHSESWYYLVTFFKQCIRLAKRFAPSPLRVSDFV